MRWTVVILVALAFIGVALANVHAPHHHALSTVMVSDEGGHGSGVHIGNGYILTAAHVVEDNKTMTIMDSDRKTQPGTVLWKNTVYDVALIRVKDTSNLGRSKLSCEPKFEVGEQIEAVGNPVNLQWVHTFGRVSGGIAERGPWKLSVLADISIGPGMSGGPVFDRMGHVVGLAVGLSIAPLGLVPSIYGVSYIVPSQAVCGLLADGAL